MTPHCKARYQARAQREARAGSGGGGGEEGDDEEGADPPLVDAEQALPLVAALLNRWRDVADDGGAAAKAAWAGASVEWASLLPSFARGEGDVAKALSKHGGDWLAAA